MSMDALQRLVQLIASEPNPHLLVTKVAAEEGLLQACVNFYNQKGRFGNAEERHLLELCRTYRVARDFVLDRIHLIVRILNLVEEEEDAYQILGLEPSATEDEIKSAFRRLSLEHHPDHNPGDPDAAERFRSIHRAYEVLSDGILRARYDHYLNKGAWSEEPSYEESKPALQKRKKIRYAWQLGALLALLLAVIFLVDYQGWMTQRYYLGKETTGRQEPGKAAAPAPAPAPVSPEKTGAADLAEKSEPPVKVALLEPAESTAPQAIPEESGRHAAEEASAAKNPEPAPLPEQMEKPAPSAEQPARKAADRPAKPVEVSSSSQSAKPQAEPAAPKPKAADSGSPAAAKPGPASRERPREPKTEAGKAPAAEPQKIASASDQPAPQERPAEAPERQTLSSEKAGAERAPAAIKPKPSHAAARPVPKPGPAPRTRGEKPRTSKFAAASSAKPPKNAPASAPAVSAESVRRFLARYARAYEREELQTFMNFFDADATENGEPVRGLVASYRRTFHNAEWIRFEIASTRWSQEGDRISVSGRFRLVLKPIGKSPVRSKGPIRLDLVKRGGDFRVKSLSYSFD